MQPTGPGRRASEGEALGQMAGQARAWMAGLALMTMVAVAYVPVGWAGYIWDDDKYVTANPAIVGPQGFAQIWTTSAADICPLSVTVWWLVHAIWLDPLPYHLLNVLLQGGCAVVLWRVLLRLKIPGAWFAAALWALHPVMVESAAWITEMKNTLSGLFYLLSMLFFVKWLQSGPPEVRRMRDWNFALVLVFAVLAMASKTSTVVLPPVLALAGWWVERGWKKRTLLGILPVLILAIIPVLLTLWIGEMPQGPSDLMETRPWSERIITAGMAVWFYLGKLAWPHPLLTVYPHWTIDAHAWSEYLPTLAVIAVLILLWRARNGWARPWFFAYAYFLVAALPTLGFIDFFILRYSFVFDHYQYLASIGPVVLAGAGLTHLSGRFLPQNAAWLRPALAALLLALCGAITWRQAGYYQNGETLWSHTLAFNPGCWVGFNNLAEYYCQNGDTDKAIAAYRRAREAGPRVAEIANNLGVHYLQLGWNDEAVEQFQDAIQISPAYAQAWYNLGNAYAITGKIDAAVAAFQKSVQINPGFTEAHSGFGFFLARLGRMDEAIAQFQQAVALTPNADSVHNNLGYALQLKGDYPAAIAQYQEALRLNPGDIKAQTNLQQAQQHAQAKHAAP